MARKVNYIWVVEMKDMEAFSTTEGKYEPSVFVGLTKQGAKQATREAEQNDGFKLRLRRYVAESARS